MHNMHLKVPSLILQSDLHVKPPLVSGDCDQILPSDDFTVLNCF